MNATSAPLPGPQSVLQRSPAGELCVTLTPAMWALTGGRFANRPYGRDGFPAFTNEVAPMTMGYRQLSIEERCGCPSDVPRAPSGKSLQLGSIDGGSGVEAQWVTIRRVPISVRARTAARASALDGARLARRRAAACVLERLQSPEQIARDLLREYLPVHLRTRPAPAQEPTPGGAATRSGSAADRRIRQFHRPAGRRTPRWGLRIRLLFRQDGDVSPCTSTFLASCVDPDESVPLTRTRSLSFGPTLRPLRAFRRRSPSPEFARHHESTTSGSSDTYSVAVGGSRNAIGRLRRFLPRKMNFRRCRRSGLRKSLAYYLA